jgi:hypothetical protein
MAYWREFPPTHLLVRSIAIWAGAFKPREDFKLSSIDDLKAARARWG